MMIISITFVNIIIIIVIIIIVPNCIITSIMLNFTILLLSWLNLTRLNLMNRCDGFSYKVIPDSVITNICIRAQSIPGIDLLDPNIADCSLIWDVILSIPTSSHCGKRLS